MGGGNDSTFWRLKFPTVTIAALLAVACSGDIDPTAPEGGQVDVDAIEQQAHGAYVDAINSNDVERLADGLTDDVVYQFPGSPELVGKAAVREWVGGYFDAYSTRWEKTSLGFTVRGDTAFERYTYKATDTDRQTGAVSTDTGKGINVFLRGEDGVWRVAIDGWSSDKTGGT